jgi:hypothetical protein
VAEVPGFVRRDEPTDELPVDELPPLQAAPRAQRTKPDATIRTSILREPRCRGLAYLTRSSGGRARYLQRDEQ